MTKQHSPCDLKRTSCSTGSKGRFFLIRGARAPQSFAFAMVLSLCFTTSAFATQGHAGIEGIIIHQMAHFFFLISMVFLFYWLGQRKLVKQQGWRHIQYAALFLILWNADVLLVHFIDEQAALIEVTGMDIWHVKLVTNAGNSGIIFIYYIAKMDHFLCVPALLFLYSGLRKLLKETAMTGNAP